MIEKILGYADLGLNSLQTLLFPAEEAAGMAEQDLGFLSTVSNVLTGVGLISTLVSIGVLYEKHVKIHWMLKWIFVPLIILDVLLVALLLGLVAAGPGKLKQAGQWIVKYVLPVAYTLGGAGVIIAMAVLPKQFLKVSYIGKVIYSPPGCLSYPPINKQPFFAIVILVRTGGIITYTAGGMIELLTGGEKAPEPDAKLLN